MGEKSRIRFIIAITLILTAAVCYSFAVGMFQRTPPVGFADMSEGPGGGTVSDAPLEDLVQVEVTPETVQSVIRTLDRYTSYRRTISIEYLSGGEVSGALTADVAVDGSWTRADVTEQNGRVEHTILGEEVRWLWYDSDARYVEAPAGQASADLVQRVPTYEDVLALDRERIVAAAYERRGEVPCVYVEVSQPELGYRERFWVSVESGLLVSAETLKGEDLVYRMTSYEVESPLAGGEDSFTLPDGTVLHQTVPT